ncbi:MAG: endoribonuclease L-PSP, partial [Gammaproteobacteria bacterium]|nr:endoribonuclease L-PSP [Gammaproteobacteria bacterium]
EDFATLNRIMADYFPEPYPARAVVGVARLPRESRVEIDAVLILRD